MPPTLAPQFAKPVLTLCAGVDHAYRLAYVGGPIFDVVAEYDSMCDAWAAMKAAAEVPALLGRVSS